MTALARGNDSSARFCTSAIGVSRVEQQPVRSELTRSWGHLQARGLRTSEVFLGRVGPEAHWGSHSSCQVRERELVDENQRLRRELEAWHQQGSLAPRLDVPEVCRQCACARMCYIRQRVHAIGGLAHQMDANQGGCRKRRPSLSSGGRFYAGQQATK